MNDPGAATRADRLRAVVARVAERVGGVPAVRTTGAVFATYDLAGGGLVAGGLAYAALVAILPGLLLVAGVAGLLITDPELRATLLRTISDAVPPLEEVGRLALDQAAAGAGPTSLLAVLGLVYGASRFYAALDEAFARIFRNAPVRHIVARYARAVVATLLVIAVPATGLLAGAVLTSFVGPAPVLDGSLPAVGLILALGSPLLTMGLFVAGVAGVLRLVPARHVPMTVLGKPALVSGLLIGAFTQLFAAIAPRLIGTAAFYGAFVAVFALLAWLAVSFNLLLLAASWTAVRLRSTDAPVDPPGAEA